MCMPPVHSVACAEPSWLRSPRTCSPLYCKTCVVPCACFTYAQGLGGRLINADAAGGSTGGNLSRLGVARTIFAAVPSIGETQMQEARVRAEHEPPVGSDGVALSLLVHCICMLP